MPLLSMSLWKVHCPTEKLDRYLRRTMNVASKLELRKALDELYNVIVDPTTGPISDESLEIALRNHEFLLDLRQ